MGSPDLVCWQCGARIEDEPLPLSRTAACRQCEAELHVCRMCEFFDRGSARSCREPVAEPPADKTRANFCGWFRARADAFLAPSGAGEESRQALEALFGGADGGPTHGADPGDELEQLFGKKRS